ncbi:MAG: hypothetical protein N0E48_24380, partial [Candidatus Thiodiazotropha endolucinida]|nr:hypothetical protein [Candidatus Thiodiazotropha taylori]MCW4346464.1 hypothetical protein [Candidatus Thiodiazotropha endolucinida]
MSSLSIFYLNIRSFRKKLDFIKENCLDFDILCFTETHLTNDIPTDTLKLEGFNDPYRIDNTAHSGGLLVYISINLLCKRRPELEHISIQSIWTEIKFKDSSLILCNIYRPPNTQVQLWDEFYVSIENALDSCSNLIIVGDLNENLLNVNN